MRILLITPARPGTPHGNRVTALRWQRLLRTLGHRVLLASRYTGQTADVLVALHARRSARAVAGFRRRHPGRPVLLALTGTDVYRDLPQGRVAAETLDGAFRLIALHPLVARELAPHLRRKVRVIRQAAPASRARPGQVGAHPGFSVCVIGHLRWEKDPLRAALAVRALPAASRLRVVHAGTAHTPAWAGRARREMARNPRYRWRGNLSPGAVARLMAASRVLVLSSRMEGGANVLSEAIGLGLPVLASRISGNVGLLGRAYPGYYPVGDTAALRRMLLRVERDPRFLLRLRRAITALRPAHAGQRERAAWRTLLQECAPG